MVTLRDLAVQFAKKSKMVDDLTNDSPILATVKWSESTDRFSNTVSKLKEVTGASIADLNGSLATLSASEDLVKFDISKMGGIIEVEEDTAKVYGGAANYFTKFEKAILRKTGANVEKNIVQTQMLNYALNNAKALKTAAASGEGYSLYAIRFVDSETCGIYGKEMPFANGDLLQRVGLYGGNLYKDSDGKLKYGLAYEGFFGFQIANDHSVGAICNIQDGKLPTSTQVEDLLDLVHADNGNTYLYCAPKCKSLLSGLKTSNMHTVMSDTNMNVVFTHWSGIPIITSYNIDKESFHSIA